MESTTAIETAVNRTINRGNALIDLVLGAMGAKEREAVSLNQLAGGDCVLRLGWRGDRVSFRAAMVFEDEPTASSFLSLEVPKSQVVDDDSAGGLAIEAARHLFERAIFDAMDASQRSTWLVNKSSGGESVTQIRWLADHIEMRCGFHFTDGREPVSLLTITKLRKPSALAKG